MSKGALISVAAFAAAVGLGGCGVPPGGRAYVTTVAPLRAIVEELARGRAEVTVLLPAGASPHTFDPRPSDVARAASALALLHVAPSLDAWATRIDAKARIEVMQLLPPEERLEMPAWLAHGHEGDLAGARAHGRDEHAPDANIDPHFWTDPLAVRALTGPLAERLCVADRDGCSDYRKNAARFTEELTALHERTKQALASRAGTRLVLAHPFLLYYMRRYGLELVGVAESAPGKEPTPRFVQELVQATRARRAQLVAVQPQLPHRAAQLLAEATSVPIVSLDPLEAGAGYASLVEAMTRSLLGSLP